MEIINSENYVDKAEKVIKGLIVKDKWGNDKINLSTSKIRNILSMLSGLYNDVVMLRTDKLTTEYISRIKYIKMRFAYEAGREKNVKEFVERAQIFKIMDSIGDSTDDLITFCNYMEALVAYHKFYGGSDK